MNHPYHIPYVGNAEQFDTICNDLKKAVETYNPGNIAPLKSALKAGTQIGLTGKDSAWMPKAATIVNRCVSFTSLLQTRRVVLSV